MAFEEFSRLMRNIRITRSMLLRDMAEDLGISSAELSAFETGRKPVPDWLIPAVAKRYNIGDWCERLLYYALAQGQDNDEGHFDKATYKWFCDHPDGQSIITRCGKCGLFYRPSLGHTCMK